MVRALTIMGLVILPLAASAQETALDKAMRKDPDRFAGQVVELIAGFGGMQGLTLAGIEEHVALERAGARAATVRRFLALDLDADGLVDRQELSITQRAANAEARGRLERQFRAADADANDRIDAAELAEQGRLAGLRALGEDEAVYLRALLSLDADGDGALTAAEIDRAVAGLEKAD